MSRPLRVGVQLPEVEREVPWAEYVAMARQAEELGFDSLWLGDHVKVSTEWPEQDVSDRGALRRSHESGQQLRAVLPWGRTLLPRPTF
jgi:alkanesulfonate monooxygenase SsuD/methylene tetrahydromethanopterin reductase-like flavin-dependent oxidoreductase (luciferase family)